MSKTNTRKFIITNLATGQLATAATYRNAQALTARMIASDTESQTVLIDGPGVAVVAFNDGFGIRYEK